MSFGNARATLDRLGVLVGHSPQDRDTREARLDNFNGHLYDICEQAPWRFLQTESDLLVWRERTYAQAGNVSATMTNAAHIVTFASSLGAFLSGGHADGLTFNDGTNDYTIGRATSATVLYLVEPYGGPTGNNIVWSIKTDKVLLPADCLQPLGYIDRENGRGRLVALDRRREELYLSPDGDNASGDVWWMVDGDFSRDRSPDSTLVATASIAAGTLTASSIYQYCYTTTYQGRATMPSIIVEATTGGGAANQIVLTGIEDVRDGALATGVLKTVYRRQVSSGSTTLGNINGRWLRMALLTEAATTYTDDGTVVPSASDSLALHFEGPRQWIRPRWFPSADATLRVRFLRRPNRLIADSDIPEGPPNLWRLILLRAAMEIVGTNSELAKSRDWERQALDLMKRLRANYLETPDRGSQKAMWGVTTHAGYTVPVRGNLVVGDFGS